MLETVVITVSKGTHMAAHGMAWLQQEHDGCICLALWKTRLIQKEGLHLVCKIVNVNLVTVRGK